jgi:hypothetical protein
MLKIFYKTEKTFSIKWNKKGKFPIRFFSENVTYVMTLLQEFTMEKLHAKVVKYIILS